MNSKKLIAEVLGWYGAFAILFAYMLVSFSIISADGIAFQLLNLTGAAGMMSIAIYKNVKQAVVLNIFWVGVATLALINIFFIK